MASSDAATPACRPAELPGSACDCDALGVPFQLLGYTWPSSDLAVDAGILDVDDLGVLGLLPSGDCMAVKGRLPAGYDGVFI